MKRPAVFFDRDNTLIVSDGYLGDPARVVLMEGAPEAIARARQYGFRVVSISNQSGVARGLFDEEAVHAVNRRMDELLQSANPSAVVERHEICFSHPQAVIEKYREDSPRRKPGPGMILEAAEELKLDLSRSWVIGDAPRDIEAGKAAGCHTVLFRAPGVPASPAADAPSDATPDFIVSSLTEAIELIAREAFKPRQAGPQPTPHPAPAAADDEPESPPAAPAPAAPDNSGPVALSVAPKNLPRPAAQAAPRTTEALLEQILEELKRLRDERPADFSVSKLLASMVQVLAVATLFAAYLYRAEPAVTPILLFAVTLQTLTIALLIMGRQR